ncbi:MAG TPA: glycosyltransferase 87 family protein [Actinomycetales bacterium]|nr:glycosyltransferase 87 family protein [Actinomycetales bacterium]
MPDSGLGRPLRGFSPTVLWSIMTVVALVAFLARRNIVERHAGLLGLHGYDDGVYYAGAAAMLAGRMPYEDFVLLHPPGILVVLAPFAELGALTSDQIGLAGARVGFWVLGAVNAALVARVAAREGLLAAAVGGLAYALSYPAIYSERTALLEPLGNTALLIALLLLGRTDRKPSGRSQVLAGAVLGAAVCIKLWMVIPLVVITLWQLLSAGWRAAVRVAAGATAVGLAFLVPFLGVLPEMFRMVVLAQLGRVRSRSVVHRMVSITGLDPLQRLTNPEIAGAVLVLVVLTGLVAVVVAVRSGERGRVYAALLVAHLAMLLLGAPYFGHYAIFLSVPAALVLATLVGQAAAISHGRRWAWPQLSLAVALVVGVVGLNATTLKARAGNPFPARRLAAAVVDRPCVVSDDDTALIAMNVFTRDLRRGCRLMVDVTGLTYDRAAVFRPDGRPVPRTANRLYQREMSSYLLSGSATILARPGGAGLSNATKRRIESLPVLAKARGYRVHGRPAAG